MRGTDKSLKIPILKNSKLAFDPKLENFSKEGRVVSFDPLPSDGLGPRSYEIEFEEGGKRKINNQWLVKYPNQNQEQNDD